MTHPYYPGGFYETYINHRTSDTTGLVISIQTGHIVNRRSTILCGCRGISVTGNVCGNPEPWHILFCMLCSRVRRHRRDCNAIPVDTICGEKIIGSIGDHDKNVSVGACCCKLRECFSSRPNWFAPSKDNLGNRWCHLFPSHWPSVFLKRCSGEDGCSKNLRQHSGSFRASWQARHCMPCSTWGMA